MWEYLGQKLFSTKVEINLKSQLEKKFGLETKTTATRTKGSWIQERARVAFSGKDVKDSWRYKGISVKVLQENSSEVCQFLSIAALFPIRTVSEKRPWLSSERKSTLTKTKLLEHKTLGMFLFKYCSMHGKIEVICPSRWSLYLSLALRGADQHPTKRRVDTAMF